MSTRYDPNNWVQDEKYHSSSANAASQLQHGLDPSKLDLFSQTTAQLIFLLEQQKYSSIFGFDNQHKIQALHAPHVSPDKKSIIGNLSDKKSQALFGIVSTSVIGKVPLIMEFEAIPASLRGRVPIPASALKSTPFEVKDPNETNSDLGIVYIPSVTALHPGMKVPSGIINSGSVNQTLDYNSPAYTKWQSMMLKLTERDDDMIMTTTIIHENLMAEPDVAKYVCGNLVPGEDTVVSSHLFSISFLSGEEEQEHSSILNNLGTIFKPNPTPIRQEQHQSRTSQESSSASENLTKLLEGLSNIVTNSSKDQQESLSENLALARLKLMGISFDIDFVKGTVSNPSLTDFSSIMSNIISSNESKAIKVERLNLASRKIFSFQPTNRAQQQNPLNTLRSMNTYSRPFLQAHLEGRLSSDNVTEFSKNTTGLTALSYLPQNNEQAVSQAKQEEEKQRSEIRLQVAENQRSHQSTFITALGSINESSDADKTFVNAANMNMLIYNVKNGNTALLELLEHYLYFLTAPDITSWQARPENQHFTWTKFEIVAQIIKAFGAFTEDIGNIDIIENKESLHRLDFKPITKLLQSLQLTTTEIEVAVARGLPLKTVSILTPDDKNPEVIERNRLISKFANINTDAGNSGATRQSNKHRQASQPPPASPTKKSQHRTKRMKNDDDKSNNVDKLKASNKRREEHRKGIGLLIPNEGVSPTQCIPSGMHEEICVFFSSINYDCGKGNLCKYAHHGKKSDFPNGDFEKLLDHIKEKKCAKLSSKWLKKSKDYKLPDKYKDLVDSTL